MKRKFLALLCIVALMVLTFASCDFFASNDDNDDNDTCEHTYSERWSTSSTEHWHAATCEHAELKTDVASHTDADENGKCDVCDYEIGHVHTFADTWTTNDTHHWKVATCSHTDEKGELAAHTDSNSDGSCDVCNAHVHVVDIFGYCSVCEQKVAEADPSNLEVIIPLVVANSGKINGGTTYYNNMNKSVAQNSTASRTQNILYKYGDGYAYYKTDYESVDVENGVTTSASGSVEKWYELVGAEEVFGVYVETYEDEIGDYQLDVAVLDNLVGVYYSVSTLTDAYGAENLLKNLYTLSKGDAASAYTYVYDAATGTYIFSFNYLDVNTDTAEGEGNHVDYYELAVEFTVSANGALTSLAVVCDCYTNSLENEIDNDYTYDQNSNTITMKDDAVADTYTFIITQTEGARTYVSEHPKSSFIPESFDAFIDEELSVQLGSSVNVTEGNTLSIYFGNFTPAESSAAYIMESFVSNADTYEGALSCWAYGGVVSFLSNVPGTYAVEFTLGNETFTFTLVVEEYVPDVVDQPDNSISVEITGADTYGWSALASFTATEDGDYTFFVPAGIGAWDKASCDAFTGSPYVDFYSNENGSSFTVSIAAGKTYEFYVSSTTRGIAVIEYTVSEYTGSGDSGDGEDDGPATTVVAGTYLGTNARGESTLVLNADGTLTMDGVAFTYTFADGVVTVYMNGNEMPSYMVGVTLGSDGKPTSFVSNGNTYNVISGSTGGDDDGDDEPTGNTLVIGANTITATAQDYANESIDYILKVTAEGTYTFSSDVLMANVYDADDMYLGRGSVYLTAGTYRVAVVLSYTSGAGTYTMNVQYTAPEVDSEADGSEGNPYELGSVPTDVTFNSDTINKVYYLYTATETGYLYITLSVADDSWCDIFLWVDGNADGSNSQSSMRETVVAFAVEAGNTYRIGLGTWFIAGDTTFSFSFESGEIGGGDNGDDDGDDEVEYDSIYADEESTVTVTDAHLSAGKLYVTLFAWEAGEYTFESNNLFVTSVTTEDGTVISKNDNWAYELEEWTTYIVEISTNYISAAGDYTITAKYNYPEGHQNNPIWYFPGEDTAANYAGNYAPYVWYQFYADATGTITFLTDSEGVTFAICGGTDYEITGEGTVSLDVVQGRLYYVGVAAFDATESVTIHFTGTITEGEIGATDGTPNLPHNMVIGENVANVPMYDGVYFMYVVEANGVLTLTSDNAVCSWYITDDLFSANYETDSALTMQVYTGDIVYVYVTTFDWSAADVVFNASFKADPTEVWYEGSIVVDGSANQIIVEENTFSGFQLSGMGTYVVTWDNANAIVVVDGMTIANGDTVTCTNPYWGPYFEVYFDDYAADTVNLYFTAEASDAIELELGYNDILVTDPAMGTEVSLSADETTTYVITVGMDTVVVYNYSNYFADDTFEITVAAGQSVSLQVASYYFTSGYYTVHVAVKEQGDVDLSDASTSASFTFTVPSYMSKSEEQSFVAAEAGTYVITAEGYENITKTYLQYYDAVEDSWTRIDTSLPYSIELTAGQTLKLRVFCWNSNDTGSSITVNVAKA